MHTNPVNGMVGKIDLEIQVPPEFPEKYETALVRSAELCAVKKHFENPPQFDVFTRTAEAVAV
jgi:ribosomal protein S12 methylthiotransferase accessory factor